MSVIIKPIVTEKMTRVDETVNRAIEREKSKPTKNHLGSRRRYAFRVLRDVNKIEIKKAVEDMYEVTVEDVNTIVVAPKRRSRYTKSGTIKGQTSAYKKAIVTLKEGDTIDFYSNI
ncbi:MAG: 50S ribosomal protein L23 [Prevotellaceae bacterium]|jgi:large subunit ribosomal protein L23|nr:50S ribosomal protein L23 [Prevotellaceae bacterium]